MIHHITHTGWSAPRWPGGAVATFGHFDTLHLGHQALLKETVALARAHQKPAIVMNFWPSVHGFFREDHQTVLPWSEKIHQYHLAGIEHVVLLKFNADSAALTADTFMARILKESLQVQQLVVGYDCAFGHQAKGNATTLKSFGFEVKQLPPYHVHNQLVSSGLVRQTLKQGLFDTAEQWLGRAFSITGRVRQGAQRGRLLGFPTANLRMPTDTLLQGVYAVKCHWAGQVYHAVANIGRRPTLAPREQGVWLEVHVFDHQLPLYGETIEVAFQAFIRPEKKMASVDALKQQIQSDIAWAKQYFEE